MKKALPIFLSAFIFLLSRGAPVPQAVAADVTEHWTFDVNAHAYAPHAFGYVPGHFFRSAQTTSPEFLDELAPALPSQWDWREHAAVNPVKDQGSKCGSCWAFASASIVESLLKINTHKKVSIAPQQLVSCDKRFDGCSGGDFASDFYINTGANYEKDYPYEGASSPCKPEIKQHEKIYKMTVLGADGKAPTTQQIKQAIYKYGPVSAAVAASADSFGYYSGGVYNDCADTNVDHMVVLVGWDDNDKAWIMRNSWGAEWGEKGYMRIKYTATDGITKCAQIGSEIGYVELTAPQ